MPEPHNTLDGLLGAAIRLGDGVSAAATDISRGLRFVRGRARFEPRDDDVFISSYPRSGTTLTQFLALLLLWGERAEARIAEARHISELTPWFERDLAHGRVDAAQLEALPSPRVFKSHLPYRWLPTRGRCVYLTRAPADVAVSYYHLYRDYLGFRDSFEVFFERFRSGALQYGSLFKHVAGWRRERGNPRVLFLDFAELTGDQREAGARRLASFLGVERLEERLTRALEQTTFAAMKEREAFFDHATDMLLARGVEAGRFLRRGERGEGKRRLDDRQLQRLDDELQRARRLPQLELRLGRFLH